MPPDARAAALDAAQTPVLVLDAPGSGAGDVVAALSAAGAFAQFDGGRLVVVAGAGDLRAAGERATGEARLLLRELLRAFAAAHARPERLRLARRDLDFTGGAAVMGILNVTPDSFYDGGAYRDVDAARRRAAEMVEQGAGCIDVGGRSYARWNAPASEEEERERVVPVVRALVRDGLGVPLSIDTSRSGVAEPALAEGAEIVNDCSGLADPQLASVVARYGAALVVMHVRGELNVREPGRYRYADALAEILAFLRLRTEAALASGVARDALLVDPGLEFGKEPQTDLEILRRFGDLRSLGYPILFAASRKTFLERVSGLPTAELLVPSLAAAAVAVVAGASVVRAHDVVETVRLVTMLGAVRGAAARVAAC